MENIGALGISAIISLIVNAFSVIYQDRKRRAFETEQKQNSWYNEIISLSRELEQIAYRLDPSAEVSRTLDGFESDNQVVIQIDEVLSELESKNARRPADLDDSRVASQIQNLENWHIQMADDDSISSIDVKQKLIDASRELKETAETEMH